MVAPNSPSARAQPSTRPASSPGPASGSATRRNVVHRLAPSVAATTSYSRSAARSAPSTLSTKNGSATNACAMTTAAVVNGMVIPDASYSGPPTRPRRPNAASSATPPTTGGSTSGTIDQRPDQGPAREVDAGQRPGQRDPDHADHGDRRQRGDQREPERVEDRRVGAAGQEVGSRACAASSGHQRQARGTPTATRRGHQQPRRCAAERGAATASRLPEAGVGEHLLALGAGDQVDPVLGELRLRRRR